MNMSENLAAIASKYFPPDILNIIQQISRISDNLGYRTYLVGGIVRDLILQRRGIDIDILVEGDAARLASSLSPVLGTSPTIHKKFNTASFKQGIYRIDLATCRSETYSHAGSLPDIHPGTLNDDLARRDFTINSMAICLNTQEFGTLIDMNGGKDDLKNGFIRILHNKSFEDDATRIMRAVRYEQRLGFRLEKNTQNLLASNLDKLDTISGDRLRHEFILWLSEPEPERIIARANRLDILHKLHSTLSASDNLEDIFISARSDESAGTLINIYLAIIIYNLDSNNLQEFLNRLNIRGGPYYRTATQTCELKNNLNILDSDRIEPAEIYFLLSAYDIASIKANLLMASRPRVQANLKLYLKKLRKVKTHISGDYLVNLGISEGQQIGKILKSVLTARLNGQITSLSEEQNLAKKMLKHPN